MKLCVRIRARILPTGFYTKNYQDYKPLWVPNPKMPMKFRDKSNPTHTRGFLGVIWYPLPMGSCFKFLLLGTMGTCLKFLPLGTMGTHLKFLS
jgi:hypothetical protein